MLLLITIKEEKTTKEEKLPHLQDFCLVPEVGLEPTRGCPHRIF